MPEAMRAHNAGALLDDLQPKLAAMQELKKLFEPAPAPTAPACCTCPPNVPLWMTAAAPSTIVVPVCPMHPNGNGVLITIPGEHVFTIGHTIDFDSARGAYVYTFTAQPAQPRAYDPLRD